MTSSRVRRIVVGLISAAIAVFAYFTGGHLPASPPSNAPVAQRAGLPPEAATTLRLIEQGGPFPFERDGVVFENREGQLPRKPRGYYHEYTVVTPGEHSRGARRIIAGDNGERYYSDDHYQSFTPVPR
jgi:ribonuclease T1